MTTASKPSDEKSDIAKIFGEEIKNQAGLSEHTWNKANGAAVALKLFGHLADEHGKPLRLSGEQEQRIALALDAKAIQMDTLETVAREAGAEIPEEARALLERILDPATFQQQLIGVGLKKPSRKVKTKLAELVG